MTTCITNQHFPVIIGICGSSRRSGVTMVALAISTYLSSGLGKWVACVELNNSGALSHILGKTGRPSIRKSGVDFFPNANLSDYSLLLKEKYDVLVLDFGVLNQSTYPEYMKCHLRMVMGFIKAWNRDNYWNYLVRVFDMQPTNSNGIIVCGNLSDTSETKQFQKCYGICPIPIPFLPNPFQLTFDSFAFIESVLERNTNTTNFLFSRR